VLSYSAILDVLLEAAMRANVITPKSSNQVARAAASNRETGSYKFS